MDETTNLHLKKPPYGVSADVADLNDNMDTIDTVVKQAQDDISSIKSWKPSEDGAEELDKVLRSNGDGTTRWDDLPSPETMAQVIGDWLDDNIDQASTAAIDDTLLVEHAAAESKTVGNKIAELKDSHRSSGTSIENDVEEITGVRPLVFQKGQYRVYSDGTVSDISEPVTSTTTSQNMVCAKCECIPGDVIKIKAKGKSTSAGAYGFFNSNFEGIERGGINALYNGTVKAPENAAWFVVNNYMPDNPTDYHAYKGGKVTDRIDKLDEFAEFVKPGDTAIEWYDGGYINSEGTRSLNQSYSYARFVNVIPETKITISTAITGAASICVYDKYDNVVLVVSSAGSGIREYQIDIPKTACYIHASCTTANKPYFAIRYGRGIVGAVTELSCREKTIQFVDNIELTNNFMTLDDEGFTSMQGMCAIDKRRIIIVRYTDSVENGRSFRVYDVVSRAFLNEAVFTEEEVGHCNSIFYYDGFVYVTTLVPSKKLVRLAYDPETYDLYYDSVVYTGEHTMQNLCCMDGIFYSMTPIVDGKFRVYRTTDFADFELAFESDFGGISDYLSPQGSTTDGEYLYFAFSSSYPNGSSSATYRLIRFTERIAVCTTDGRIVKWFEFSRGSHGEIEDIAIIARNNRKILFTCVNRKNNVSCVYASPLESNETNDPLFDVPAIKNFSTSNETQIYVSNSGTPFADGTPTRPFQTVNGALNFIKKMNTPATIILMEGEYSPFSISGINAALTIDAHSATVSGDISISKCSRIIFETTTEDGLTVRSMTVEKSSVMIVGDKSVTIDGANETTIGLSLSKSIAMGDINISNCDKAIFADNAMAVLSGIIDGETEGAFVVINGQVN